jgi:MSHA pilin protein MshA
MVIVILGILSATALPKFVNLTGEAHQATADAVLGAAKSAAAMNFAAVLAGANDATGTTATGIAADATGAAKLLTFIDVSGWTVSNATLTASLGTKTFVITITTAESATSKAELTLSSS